MAPLTALFMVFSAVAVVLHGRKPSHHGVKWFGLLTAGLLAGGGGLACLRAWSDWASPVEAWLPQTTDFIGGIPLGRMSPGTGAVFVLVAVALFLRFSLAGRRAGGRRVCRFCASAVILVGVLVLASYATGKPWLYGGNTIPMALWTALSLVFLGMAIWCPPLALLIPDARAQSGSDMPLKIASVAALVIGVLGALYLRQLQSRIREEAGHLLGAIGESKVAQIVHWKAERLSDARFFAEAAFVAEDVESFLRQPDSETARAELTQWLNLLKGGDRYAQVALFDTNVMLRLAVPEATNAPSAICRALIVGGLWTNRVGMSDLHRGEHGEGNHIDLIVPVSATAVPSVIPDSARTLGAVLIRVDPRGFLYPLIQSWPVPSRTAETILFRHEGKDVLCLNELRHQTNTALTLRFPVDGVIGLPAAMAELQKVGQVEGRDYRNTPVLANIRPVPGSEWHLVVKVDRDEIFAPLRQYAWLTLILTVALAAVAGVIAKLLWSRREAAHASRELAVQRQHLALAQRVEHLMKNANDAIVLADDGDRILETNERMQQMYGYDLAELQTMHLSQLRAPETHPGFAAQSSQVWTAGRALFETLHRRKDGSIFPVEISSNVVELDGRTCKLGILRDITQRRAHEREIERLTRLYSTLSQVNQTIVRVRTREELFQEVCRIAVEYGAFKLAWIGELDGKLQQVIPVACAGDTERKIGQLKVYADDRPEGRGTVGDCLRTGKTAVSNDFANDPRSLHWRDSVLGYGLRATVALPIRVDGAIWGVLTVYAGEINVFQDKEIRLLEEMALDISYALKRLREEEQRLRAEEQLRKLSRAVEQSPAAIVITNSSGQIEYVNPKFRAVSGYTLEEVQGKNPRILKSGETPGGEYRQLWQTISRGEEWRGEFHNRKKNGELYWEFASISPVLDDAGRITHFVAVKEDITERKQAESALRLANARLRRFLDANLIGTLTTNADGKILEANDYYLNLIGFSRAELEQGLVDWRAITPPEWLPADELALRELRERGHCTPYEKEYLRRDGTRVPVLLADAVLPGPEGQIAAFALDLTDRKRAKAALHESERRFRELMETVQMVTVMLDGAGRISFCNDYLLHLTGCVRQQVLHQDWFELFIAPESRESLRAVFQSVMDGTPVDHYENEIVTRKGERRMISWSNTSLKDDSGRIIGVASIGSDITEQKRLEAQIRQTQKMEAIGQLAGGVAHDFNNILAATLMQVGMLQTNPGLDAEAREVVQELEANTQRAAGLTRQLLLFSRRSVMQVVPLNLNEVVENLLKMLRRVIGEHVKLDWQGASRSPTVSGDAGMLEQVLMNLVVNARDAMPNGGRVTIATDNVEITRFQARGHPEARPGRFICLSVADTGSGMSADVLKRIFEPFFTTKSAGRGTGLGLATVYGIVAQHRGWVTVESAVGQGTTFRVYLPTAEVTAAKGASEQPAQPLRRGHETILFVEDDADVRHAIGTFLQRLGYQVLEAANAVEATARWTVHNSPVDLLFTDMVLPGGVNGLQLIEKLRAVKPELKVILASGYSADLLQQGDLAGQGITFMPKPCSPVELAAIIRRCLDQPSAR